jgi:SAM-dependent methyltransferase
MVSLLDNNYLNKEILDFGAGSCWISEFCARMGLKVVSFDIHGELDVILSKRINFDKRVNGDLIRAVHGDGHNMPFCSSSFGHILCYDTFHHMLDFEKVFSEFYRILFPGASAIFVEPGANHSKSDETQRFVAKQKKFDPSWIERDIVLEEMDCLAIRAGFRNGIVIVPVPHPFALSKYSMTDWNKFRSGNHFLRSNYTDDLSKLNYFDRVIFKITKPLN